MADCLLLLHASISDVYGILAPLESFMHVPPDLCHQHFYEVSRLCRRSLVFTLQHFWSNVESQKIFIANTASMLNLLCLTKLK